MATPDIEFPPIHGDLRLDVFTHRSLGLAPDNQYGDTARLAELGAKILESATTFCLFAQTPQISADEMSQLSKHALSDSNVQNWAAPIRKKLRVHVSASEEADSAHELRFLFNSYFGAVFVQSGFQVVTNWMSKQLDPECNPPPLPGSVRDTLPHSTYVPRSPGSPPPPLPSTTSSSVGALAAFNQTASQRKMTIRWEAKATGPSHMLRWEVTCLVNDIEKGMGVGDNKNHAKEVAARVAAEALGWNIES